MQNSGNTWTGYTMKWKDKLIEDFLYSLQNITDISVLSSLRKLKQESVSLHLAVFTEPFLSLILSGKKTMESRFSINHLTPYRKIVDDDIVLIKRSGGAICGFFIAGSPRYFSNLRPEKIYGLELLYGKKSCWDVDPEFLNNKSGARFLTLIEIKKVIPITPIEISKSDRTAWSIVKTGLQNTLFSNDIS